MGLYMPFEKDFEPIVRIGEKVAIPKTSKEYEYFEVVYVEPVLPIVIPVSLTASQINKEVNLDEIKLEDNEAGQWRLKVLDYALVKMNYPRAAAKWVTKSEITSAQPTTPENLLEFYTYKDDVPTLLVDNPLNETQTARIMVYGFKYSLRGLAGRPSEFTVLPAYSAVHVVGGGK